MKPMQVQPQPKNPELVAALRSAKISPVIPIGKLHWENDADHTAGFTAGALRGSVATPFPDVYETTFAIVVDGTEYEAMKVLLAALDRETVSGYVTTVRTKYGVARS